MSKQYTYAVACIHAKEGDMLTKEDLERLISAADFENVKNILNEKGYDTTSANSTEEILSRERGHVLKLAEKVIGNMSSLKILFYDIDFHNLKTAIKASAGGGDAEKAFISGGTFPFERIKKTVDDRDFSGLPEHLKKTAEKALKIIFETGNASICDAFIDKAYLEALILESKKSDIEIIVRYAQLTVALSNIRIAIRGARQGRNIDFFKRSLADCDTLLVSSLAEAAATGEDKLGEHLALTQYSDVLEVLKKPYSAVEKWADNKIMSELKKEKRENFGIGPIAAYILAKETEIRMVGLILTAKQNRLSGEKCRERLRELYV